MFISFCERQTHVVFICMYDMHTDEEIKAAAYQQLGKLPANELEILTELDIEIKIPATEGRVCRYAVFFEREAGAGKRDWMVRNIIRPDNLENPQPKADKIE